MTCDLLTNGPDIDSQHRLLFDLANQVVDPSTIDRGPDYFLEVTSFLANYVDFHFAAEETVMSETRFPRAEVHRNWHDSFRSEVHRFAEQARSEGVSKSLKLKLSFAIENWLLDHIRINDRELAQHILHQSGLRGVELPDPRALKAAGILPAHYDDGLWTRR